MTTFAALGTPKALADTLTAQGIVEPFPIQVKTLPDTLAGRDVLGRGRTGSGKTIAFAIPLVARLAEREAKHFRKPGRPMGLVLAPTRELATQINATIEPMAKAMGLTTTVIYGGISQARQEKALRAGVDIVIACPGRLEDLVNQRVLRPRAPSRSPCWTRPITWPISASCRSSGGCWRDPPAGASDCCSPPPWTTGSSVLVKEFLSDPLIRTPSMTQTSPVSTMEHHVFAVSQRQTVKKQVIVSSLRVAAAGCCSPGPSTAPEVGSHTLQAGIPAVDLHGNLSQNARERNLAAFSSGSAGPGGHRHRRPRHPRRRRRTGRPRGPADRAQGVPAPLRPYGPCRRPAAPWSR